MEVGFRENNVSRQNETNRKTDTKCEYVCCNTIGNVYIAIDVKSLFVKNKVEADTVQYGIQYSIRSATGKVPKGLSRYPPGKRTMEKVNNAYNNMSRKR